MPFLDDFSPDIVGSDRIGISLDPSSLSPTVARPVIFLVDYSGASVDGGIVLPLELIVQAPTIAGFYRKTFSRFPPTRLVYFPISSGPHLIRIAETGHNRFFGSFAFDAAGDPIVSVRVAGREVAV